MNTLFDRRVSRQKIARALTICLALFFVFNSWTHPLSVRAAAHQFYDASLELSDSLPAAPNDWTVDFRVVQEIPSSGYLTIIPEAGEFSIPEAMDYTDLDISIDGSDVSLATSPGSGAGATWGVEVVSGMNGRLTLTNNDTDPIPADSRLVIEIGTHATFGSTGESQIENPLKINNVGSADVWRVDLASFDQTDGELDYITLLVATIEHINIYAGPMPHMVFEISAVTAPDGGDIASDEINWRGLTALTPKTAVLRIKVNTDAQNGYVVYIKQNHNMIHDEDAAIDIDLIRTAGIVGTNDAPVAWSSPTGSTIAVDTGFLGYTTSDTTLNNVGTGVNRFATESLYSGLTTTSEEILYHPEATQSNLEGQDFTDVTFQIEVNNLQPTGNYFNDIIFIAKPVF